MWSEEMDRKIRAAAENDVHGYEDKNWGDMEVLLEKHLPQKKRRRGIIVFFLLAAMSVSGWLLFHSISSSNNKNDKAVTDNKKETTAGTTTTQNKPAVPITNPGENTNTNVPSVEQLNKKQELKENLITKEKEKKAVIIKSSFLTTKNNNTKSTENIFTKSTKHPIEKDVPSTTNNDVAVAAIDNTINNNNTTQQTITEEKKEEKAEEKKAEKIEEPIAEEKNEPAKKEKQSKSFASKLSLYVSAGPDLSSVGFKHSGQVKGQVGVGVGYAISDKLGIRTGFYAGRKIYSADSASYKSIYVNNPNMTLEKVDANCFVYEIPVNLIYSFNPSKQHSWFASAGLSSYIMKEEKYNLLYKYGWAGTQYVHQSEYRNENSHFFSILSLSGGYKYNFSKRFSLLAEPYVKFPLSGIGAGKVKLNNAGVLFTAALKPFGK
jgi:hypothetical protein